MARAIAVLAAAGALLALALWWQQAHLALAGRAIEPFRQVPEPVATASVGRYLDRANAWPDADARMLKSRWLAMTHEQTDRAAALATLVDASRLRPAWYRPWAARAVILAGQDPADAAWQEAADEALSRGPNETRLFATLFPVWRIHWHHLDAARQQRIHELALATARREPALMVDLAEQYGYLGPVCREAGDHRVVRQQCDKLGFSEFAPEAR